MRACLRGNELKHATVSELPVALVSGRFSARLLDEHFARSLAPLECWKCRGDPRTARNATLERAGTRETRSRACPLCGIYIRSQDSERYTTTSILGDVSVCKQNYSLDLFVCQDSILNLTSKNCYILNYAIYTNTFRFMFLCIICFCILICPICISVTDFSRKINYYFLQSLSK